MGTVQKFSDDRDMKLNVEVSSELNIEASSELNAETSSEPQDVGYEGDTCQSDVSSSDDKGMV